MEATATSGIQGHILGKIQYHEKLRLLMEAEEQYDKCAYHRDEIIRLKKMLS